MSGAPVRRTGDETTGSNILNLRVVPIVFVPGVMGSRLSVPGGINWDPDANLDMVRLSLQSRAKKIANLSVASRPVLSTLRKLSGSATDAVSGSPELGRIADAAGRPVTSLYADRGWGTVAWGFYGVILMQLETSLNIATEDILSLPNPVHAFGYDWRRSNADSGAALVAFIAETLGRYPGANEVIVVTHSMGGIVARAGMAMNPGVMGSIVGVIHGAQPSLGAVVAYRRFLTGATSKTDGATSGGVMPYLAATVLNRVMGTTPQDYASLQAGLPGPMELLPSYHYPKFDDRGPWLRAAPPVQLEKPTSVYCQEASPPGILVAPTGDMVGDFSVNAQLSMQVWGADGLHRLLGTSGHPETHVLYSTGVATDVGVDASQSNLVIDKQPLGDGTVPAVSAQLPHLPAGSIKSRQEFHGLEHADVFKDTAFNQATVDLVSRLMLQSFRLP